MEALWVGGTKVPSNGHDHITKMATMPIYGKNVKKSFSLEYYQIPSNEEPGLTLTYFTARSKG